MIAPDEAKLIGFATALGDEVAQRAATDVAQQHGDGVTIEKDNGSMAAVVPQDADTDYNTTEPSETEAERIREAYAKK